MPPPPLFVNLKTSGLYFPFRAMNERHRNFARLTSKLTRHFVVVQAVAVADCVTRPLIHFIPRCLSLLLLTLLMMGVEVAAETEVQAIWTFPRLIINRCASRLVQASWRRPKRAPVTMFALDGQASCSPPRWPLACSHRPRRCWPRAPCYWPLPLPHGTSCPW